MELVFDGQLAQDEFKNYRGVPTEPGKAPPGRENSIEENLELFEKMKNGELEAAVAD